MASPLMAGVSRRQFLGYSAALPFLFQELAQAQRKRVKIRDQGWIHSGDRQTGARPDAEPRRRARTSGNRRDLVGLVPHARERASAGKLHKRHSLPGRRTPARNAPSRRR